MSQHVPAPRSGRNSRPNRIAVLLAGAASAALLGTVAATPASAAEHHPTPAHSKTAAPFAGPAKTTGYQANGFRRLTGVRWQ